MTPEPTLVEIPASTQAVAIADEVTSTVVNTALQVDSHVGEVDRHLAEQSEVTEEHHEEILEGQAWLENQFQLLQSNLLNLQTSQAATAAAFQTQLQTLTLQFETMIQRLSTDSNPSIPPTPTETTVIVEPENVEVENPVPETSVVPTKRRRKLI